MCLPGYQFASSEWCAPCPRARYKPAVGNAECALTCPTNADSELASTSLDDCFCRENFHAVLTNGQLESCRSCSYQGLVCLGGWSGNNNTARLHSQPLALHPGLSHLSLLYRKSQGLDSIRLARPQQWNATSSCFPAKVFVLEVNPVLCKDWAKKRPAAVMGRLEPRQRQFSVFHLLRQCLR